MTLAIGHVEDGRAVLDCLREVRPPFSPEAAPLSARSALRTKRHRLTRAQR